MSKTNVHLPKSNLVICWEVYNLMFIKHFEAQNNHASIVIIDNRNNFSDECYFSHWK